MTKHEIIIGNSNNLKAIPDGSVNLIVTSPPYAHSLMPHKHEMMNRLRKML